MERVTVFYSGRVQGVGFRVTVRQIARGFDVTGAVRNLFDGRVELVAEGEKGEVTALKASPPATSAAT
jgi:acylphosphatase